MDVLRGELGLLARESDKGYSKDERELVSGVVDKKRRARHEPETTTRIR